MLRDFNSVMILLSAPVPAQKNKQKVVIPFPEENENVTRWIVDQKFRREQERLKIPQGTNTCLLSWYTSVLYL